VETVSQTYNKNVQGMRIALSHHSTIVPTSS